MQTRTDTLQLGEVEIIRVYEAPRVELPRAMMFPDADPALWRDNRDWLAPGFWNPDGDQLVAAMQTWVLRSAGRTILVDTGIGNAKQRPGMPLFHQLDTGYLDNLAAAGVRPEDVDLVVITHVHGDHVGWNTVLDGDEWVPTFANARYLINRDDFDFWNPANGHATRSGPRMANVFEDSVAPVHRAGRTELWQDHHDVDEYLSLAPAPGHTPGSAVLTLRSGGDRAVFVGDLLHTPLQVPHPGLSPCFDEDEAVAAASRRRVLGTAAEQRQLVLPAHLPGPGALQLRRRGDGFEIHEWAPFG